MQKKFLPVVIAILMVFSFLAQNSVADNKINHRFKYVYAKDNCSMAIKEDGTVWEWGFIKRLNSFKVAPVMIPGLADVKAISSTMALKNDGTVWSLSKGTLPEKIDGLKDIMLIDESYAVAQDGTIYIVRPNEAQISKMGLMPGAIKIKQGFLLKGDGTLWHIIDNNTSLKLKEFDGINGIVDFDAAYINDAVISMGFNNICILAIKKDGTVWSSSIGKSLMDDKIAFENVLSLNNAKNVAIFAEMLVDKRMSGMHDLGVNAKYFVTTNSGELWSWGANERGELGSYLPQVNSPQLINNISDVKSVASGLKHTVVLKNDGTLWSFGDNTYGQLGIGSSGFRKVPQKIMQFQDIKMVSAGTNHTSVIRKDGTVWEWYSSNYQDSKAKDISEINLTKVTGLSDIVWIQSEPGGGLAIDQKGYLWSWNNNSNIYTTYKIDGISNVQSAAKDMVLKKDGTLWNKHMWNEKYIKVEGISGIKQIAFNDSERFGAVSYFEYLALKNDGTAWEINIIDGEPKLNKIPGIKDIKAIDVTSNSYILVSSYGSLWSFPYGGTNLGLKGPEIINDLTGIKAISAGFGSLLVLKDDNSVWMETNGFTKVSGLNNITSISTGGKTRGYADFFNDGKTYYSALSKDGSLWLWGYNQGQHLGKLGSNTSVPAKVIDCPIYMQVNNAFISSNGDEIEVDPGRGTTPVIDNSRVLLPIRSLIENLGGNVSWNDKNKKCVIKLNGKSIELIIGSKIGITNGITKEMDVAPKIINDRTMIPIRYVIENLDLNIDWDEKTQGIYIY